MATKPSGVNPDVHNFFIMSVASLKDDPIYSWYSLTVNTHSNSSLNMEAVLQRSENLSERKPINKNYYNTTYRHPVILLAGLLRSRSNWTHTLWHFCASTWLEHGVGIRAVAEYLGHSYPGFTLRIYTHLMPKSDEGARTAFDHLR